jgi:hypothetical protein
VTTKVMYLERPIATASFAAVPTALLRTSRRLGRETCVEFAAAIATDSGWTQQCELRFA